MLIISLSDCPPKVRGDLTKWLCEISTGVYVGKVSSRVRDELWDRITGAIKNGRATMVFTVNNEQGFDFRVHNTAWQPVDFDGIKLMKIPSASSPAQTPDTGFSKAAIGRKVRAINAGKRSASAENGYVVIDVETTGLNPQKDRIIEIAAVSVDNELVEEWSSLIKTDTELGEQITKLTGITENMCSEEGIELIDALKRLADIVGSKRIVCHNAPFDLSFLRRACEKCELSPFTSPYDDTLRMARRKLPDLQDHSLSSLADYFGIVYDTVHRALPDCKITAMLYQKLNEI